MNRKPLLVGGFTVGAVLLAVGLVFWLGGSHLFQRHVQAILYFKKDVAGLSKGGPVTFRGVPVGQVVSIAVEIDPKGATTRIPVEILLSSNIVSFRGAAGAVPTLPDLVARGLRAKLVSQSLVTGQKSIELDMVLNSAPMEVSTGEITEIPVIDDRFNSLVDQLADVPVRDTVVELRKTLADMRLALASANSALLAAHQTLDAAGREFVALSAQTRGTLSVASLAIGQVQANSAVALSSVTRLADTANGTVESARPELLRTLASASQAAESARVAMSNVSDMSAPNAPMRSDLEGAMADLSQAARGLREWSELLEEQPNALIFGRKRP